MTQDQVSNPNLELKLYGDREQRCSGAWERRRCQQSAARVDAGFAPRPAPSRCAIRTITWISPVWRRIRWVTKVSGFHQVHPDREAGRRNLAGGRSRLIGSTVDWHESEFSIAEVRWLKLDIAKVVTRGNWVEHPDLSKVDESRIRGPDAGQRTRPGRMVRCGVDRSVRQAGEARSRNEIAPAASSKVRLVTTFVFLNDRRDRSRSAEFRRKSILCRDALRR